MIPCIEQVLCECGACFCENLIMAWDHNFLQDDFSIFSQDVDKFGDNIKDKKKNVRNWLRKCLMERNYNTPINSFNYSSIKTINQRSIIDNSPKKKEVKRKENIVLDSLNNYTSHLIGLIKKNDASIDRRSLPDTTENSTNNISDRNLSRDTTEKKLPKWLSSLNFDNKDNTMNEIRDFALSFLKGCMRFFTDNKVNSLVVVKNLEYAIFLDLWSANKDKYWDKIYTVTASLSLHHENNLIQEIESGRYANPRDIVLLNYKQMGLTMKRICNYDA